MMQKTYFEAKQKCEAKLRNLFSLAAKILFLLFQSEQCEEK
jgi:hypothetical protein